MKGTTGEPFRANRPSPTPPQLLEGDYAALGGHLREANRVGELRSQYRKVCLGHPTGDRARPSDVDGYPELLDLLDKLPQRREANAVDGVDHARLDEARRFP
jgi:hypothetical protein